MGVGHGDCVSGFLWRLMGKARILVVLAYKVMMMMSCEGGKMGFLLMG